MGIVMSKEVIGNLSANLGWQERGSSAVALLASIEAVLLRGWHQFRQLQSDTNEYVWFHLTRISNGHVYVHCIC